jgi:AraC-like DNA-binding protein
MSSFDIVLRSMAGMQLLFLAWLLLVRGRREPALSYAALLPAGLAAFMLTSAPLPAGTLGAAALPLTLVCVANPAWFWIFGKAWFDDDFRPGARELAAVVAMIGVGLAHEVGAAGAPSAPLDAAFKGAILLFTGATLINVARGRRADLDERRRRARIGFVAAVFVYALVAVALQVAYAGRLPAELVRANVALLLACALLLSAWLASRPAHMHADIEREPAIPQASTVAAPAELPAQPAATPLLRDRPAADEALVARIRAAMESDRIYRREALTVAGLAQALGSQEYRVRRAINQGLGYRNFNDFLHHYRLEEASVRLRTQRHLPILTIALDVGFGSIGPFNRAFRTRFACTPSQYRAGPDPARATNAAVHSHDPVTLHDDAPAPGLAAV